jgi:hypothetical protein
MPRQAYLGTPTNAPDHSGGQWISQAGTYASGHQVNECDTEFASSRSPLRQAKPAQGRDTEGQLRYGASCISERGLIRGAWQKL